MKTRQFLAIILVACWFSVAPAFGHDCCHHGYHCGDNDSDCCPNGQRQDHCRKGAAPSGVADLQTVEGKISEVVYLPGATPGSSMVELRLQSAGQSQLVRLAPAGFLKQSGLLLREGDAVSVKGFAVAAMEGDLLVATEVQKGDKALALRDTRGRPVW